MKNRKMCRGTWEPSVHALGHDGGVYCCAMNQADVDWVKTDVWSEVNCTKCIAKKKKNGLKTGKGSGNG